MKTEQELRDKLADLLAVDVTLNNQENAFRAEMFAKAACAKTLLWALGENDDDRWHITAKPGPPVLMGRPS